MVTAGLIALIRKQVNETNNSAIVSIAELMQSQQAGQEPTGAGGREEHKMSSVVWSMVLTMPRLQI